jgi:hypothetical protein
VTVVDFAERTLVIVERDLFQVDLDAVAQVDWRLARAGAALAPVDVDLAPVARPAFAVVGPMGAARRRRWRRWRGGNDERLRASATLRALAAAAARAACVARISASFLAMRSDKSSSASSSLAASLALSLPAPLPPSLPPFSAGGSTGALPTDGLPPDLRSGFRFGLIDGSAVADAEADASASDAAALASAGLVWGSLALAAETTRLQANRTIRLRMNFQGR